MGAYYGGRIKGLRAKMKESQKHMDELDKHLYEPLGFSMLHLQVFAAKECPGRVFADVVYCREEFAKSQGGEQN